MELNAYQSAAMKTCMPSSNNFAYMFLNLIGECGEFASKVAKAIRKQRIIINDNELNQDMDLSGEDFNIIKEELEFEAGDILWQLTGLINVMGWTLEEVAQMNLDKLASRQQRSVIEGNGDNR